MSRCAGCATPIEPSGSHDRRRKWCSERCRKASYGQPCIDCGARTSFGAERARAPEPRCSPCAAIHRTRWTPEAIIEAIQAWAREHGEPPAAPDWEPYQARKLGDEARALRFEQAGGRWPSRNRVIEVFGSWNAAIVAAGFQPRAAHGGGTNVERRRSMRARTAA